MFKSYRFRLMPKLLNKWEGHNYFLDLEQKENDIVCVEDLKTKELMTRKSTKSLNRQITDLSSMRSRTRQRCQYCTEYFVVGSCYGNTYNTAGTAEINACGVSKPLVDEGHNNRIWQGYDETGSPWTKDPRVVHMLRNINTL
jgi:hypothetical protein